MQKHAQSCTNMHKHAQTYKNMWDMPKTEAKAGDFLFFYTHLGQTKLYYKFWIFKEVNWFSVENENCEKMPFLARFGKSES